MAAIDDLTIALDPTVTPDKLKHALATAAPDTIDLAPWVTAEAVEGLKFSECLPRELAVDVVTRRLFDRLSTEQALREHLVAWRFSDA